MDASAFLKMIKQDPVQPIYFLYGEESYYIDLIGKYLIDRIVEPSMKDFNYSVLYGIEVHSKTVRDALMRYPMMAPYQVIVLKEAHRMRNFSDLLPYFEAPHETSVFIIEYKNKIDKRKKVFKTLSKLNTAFESNPIRDYQIAQWINDYIKEKKWEIDPETTRLLTEHLGTDLQKIVNELDKIMLNKKESVKITTDDIERYVGISKEFNVFELQKAIGSGNKNQAAQIILGMAENEKENPPIMIVSMLYAYFLRIYKMHFLRSASQKDQLKTLGLSHSIFLREFQQASSVYSVERCEGIIDLLFEYDLKSKGFENPAGSSGELLKELLYRIIT